MRARRPRLASEVRSYYETNYREADRLASPYGRLEFDRTTELLARFLPSRPSTIYDVGGGPGAYAVWLARRGHLVYLVDPIVRHVHEARRAGNRPGRRSSVRVFLGDARSLPFSDATADAVLLLGPLYHLTTADGRRLALREAMRVLKPGGLLFAVAISRFASMFDGSHTGYVSDPKFPPTVDRELRDGQHRNPAASRYFTTAYFHEPLELSREVRRAGFREVGTFAVEGYLAWIPQLGASWRQARVRQPLLRWLRRTESEPTLLGVSPHILSVATKRTQTKQGRRGRRRG